MDIEKKIKLFKEKFSNVNKKYFGTDDYKNNFKDNFNDNLNSNDYKNNFKENFNYT